MRGEIYTIGHSTLSSADFVQSLGRHGIERVIDVRSVPRSRHCPQFDQPRMGMWLAAVGVGYEWHSRLGGYPAPYPTHVDNSAWRKEAFRRFADYMQSSRFASAMGLLCDVARGGHAVIMCCERDPSKCHRSMVTDALIARGWSVKHIVGESLVTAEPHDTAVMGPGWAVHYPKKR